MGAASRAWMVAAAVGVAVALKGQGLSRWNYPIRSVHHHAKTKLRSLSRASGKMSSPATRSIVKATESDEAKRSEESLRTVMFLSCWGPYN